MATNLIHFLQITLLLCGLSVQQTKSDSIRNGIIMNSANEKTEVDNDDGTNNNMALADGSIDKNAVVVRQQQSVDDNADVDNVIRIIPNNGSIQQQQPPKQQIDPGDGNTQFNRYVFEYLTKHPGAIVVQPHNRTDNMDSMFRYSFPKANNIEAVIHLLDINPYANWLFVNSTSISGPSDRLNLTAHIEPPNVKKKIFLNTSEICIHFWFKNSEWSRYRGFLMTIQPIDEKQANITSPNNLQATKSMSDDNLKILIGVVQSKQNNETWKLFRLLLANSTDKFIKTTDIKVMERCSENDVIFINILPCQSAWPNAQNCVEIDFSIQIKLNSTMKSATNQTTEAVVDTYTMKHDELVHMWLDFGRKELADNGYQEFPVPNTQKLLFIWGTISLMVIFAFLLVLLLIWKMDMLRDYRRRMYWGGGHTDDEKQICKPTNVSMYPPVHQIVPTLFPNDLNTSNNLTNAIPFDYVNRPITFDVGDFKRRQSLEETLQPSENLKRKAGEVPFQSDIEFNESKQDRPEDEMYFNSSSLKSP